MADHELIDESERERFAGTSAMSGRHDRDGDGVDDRREGGTLDTDYDRGRRDEAIDENDRPARFDRDATTAETETRRDDAPTTRY
jgi:hypothetical protein